VTVRRLQTAGRILFQPASVGRTCLYDDLRSQCRAQAFQNNGTRSIRILGAVLFGAERPPDRLPQVEVQQTDHTF
jgi:hypothetical protein